MGFWVADPTKATAYIGPSGRLMMIQPAKKSSDEKHKHKADVSTSSQQSLYELLNDSEHDTSSPTSPMLSTDVNLMMSGLFHGLPGNEFLRGGQITGPPEAFYPFRSFGADGRLEAADDDDDYDDEAMLDVEDFIDFGNESSEDETDEQGANEDRHGKSTALVKNSSHALLDHLNGNNVTAFRRNTARVHAYLKLPKHREFMQFSPPGTSSAVKSGRHSELYAPIAPPRKRKRDNSNPGVESSRGNTLQRQLVNAHKRSKSAL